MKQANEMQEEMKKLQDKYKNDKEKEKIICPVIGVNGKYKKTTTFGDVVDITVSVVEVRRLRQRQIQEARWPEGGWKQYRYSYSCDDNKWIPINCNE